MVNDLRRPVTVKLLESRELLELRRLLDGGPLKVVADSGEALELPPNLCDFLRQIVEQMEQGRALALVPGEKVVTTQQGATMLGMSRPSFIKLLDQRRIPHHRVGNQRRVLLRELLDYLHRRDGDRWMARAKFDLLMERLEKSGRPLEWREEI